MLLPRRVEEVVVTVPARLYDDAVAALAESGIFHVDEPPRDFARGYVSRKYRGLYARINEKAGRIESYYKALGLEPSRVEGLKIEASSWEEAYEKTVEQYMEVERLYERGVQRLGEIDAEARELQQLYNILSLLKHIDVDIQEATRATYIGFAVGFATGEGVEGAVERAASKTGVVAAVESVGEDTYLVAAAGHPASLRKFLSSMRAYSWTPFTIPEHLPGSPAEAYKAVAERLEALAREEEKIRGELAEAKSELDAYYTIITTLREVARLLANTVFTKTMAVFRGFVDKRDSRKLRDLLSRVLGGAYLLASLGVRRAQERVPSKVDLPRFLKPFHKLVSMYGEPDPDEIVPTVFVAVTFPLIFALMFPDMGHGLLVLLFAQWYFRRRDQDWRFILSVLGAASMITGFLAAEFFGPLPAAKLGLPRLWESLGFHTPPLAQATYAVEEGLGAEVAKELLFNIISIALWIGGFMLAFGAFLGVVDAWLKGDKIHALTSKMPTFVFLTAVALPFLVTASASEGGAIIKQALLEKGGGELFPTIVFAGVVVGLLWKFLGEPVALALEGENPLHGLGHGFMEAYEMLLMALGNIPSFLRIMGLGLAHSGLMLGFTQLYHTLAHSEALPGVIAVAMGLLVYAFGNLMVAALEAIIAFAHSLRLHFYEWFSKFYSGQGVRFEPVRVTGVRIILVH